MNYIAFHVTLSKFNALAQAPKATAFLRTKKLRKSPRNNLFQKAILSETHVGYL